jgi:predicted nucleic acid-binding protein
MAHLRKQENERLVVFPQNIIEFYSIATRASNSLKLSPEDALKEVAAIEKRFTVLLERPGFFSDWKELVFKYKPTNRQVYDFRLIAMMLNHGVPKILTFNDKDFENITEIQTINPFDLLNLRRV